MRELLKILGFVGGLSLSTIASGDILTGSGNYEEGTLTSPVDNKSVSYCVEEGDCLWRIAEVFYKDGNEWTKIYSDPENYNAIGNNPDIIKPGMTLKLKNPTCNQIITRDSVYETNKKTPKSLDFWRD